LPNSTRPAKWTFTLTAAAAVVFSITTWTSVSGLERRIAFESITLRTEEIPGESMTSMTYSSYPRKNYS